MTLGEKLCKARKENNITQEQLSDVLGVSRQSVSKWESDTAFPETDKLIRMSELFGVSLDYLLKENDTTGDRSASSAESSFAERAAQQGKTVSVDDARRFLAQKRQDRKKTAAASALCILSPLCLMVLGAVSEQTAKVSENTAAGIGLSVMFAMVAVAVGLFIYTAKQGSEFAFLETEKLLITPELKEFATAEKSAYANVRMRCNIAGVVLCVCSVIPLLLGMVLFGEKELPLMIMLCVMFVMVAVAVVLFLWVGVPWAAIEKLLQEGDYTEAKKKNRPFVSLVVTAYWMVATALYLVYSFVTNQWEYSWIVWPVAGVLFPVVLALCRLRERK